MLPTRIAPKIVLNETEYTIELLPMSAVGRLQGLINEKPNPKPLKAELAAVEDLRKDGLIPDDEAKEMRADAYRESQLSPWPPDLIAELGRVRELLFYDAAIRAEFLMGTLKPTPTLEEAAKIGDTISFPDFMRAFSSAFAIKDEPDSADPKAERADSPESESIGASDTAA